MSTPVATPLAYLSPTAAAEKIVIANNITECSTRVKPSHSMMALLQPHAMLTLLIAPFGSSRYQSLQKALSTNLTITQRQGLVNTIAHIRAYKVTIAMFYPSTRPSTPSSATTAAEKNKCHHYIYQNVWPLSSPLYKSRHNKQGMTALIQSNLHIPAIRSPKAGRQQPVR